MFKGNKHLKLKKTIYESSSYSWPGKITCDTVDDPIIKDKRDTIIKVTATAICGSDLHM